jgi:hypothetical protein
MNALCLCRDQPQQCVCTQRTAAERRDRINAGMAFAAQVLVAQARRQVPAAPVPYPLGYGERDAQV